MARPGCDEMAGEVPMGVAAFDHVDPADDYPGDGGTEALDAGRAKVSDWYLLRWAALGWEIDPEVGSATKTFDGKVLRATIDGWTEETYSVVVSRVGAPLCS